MIRRVDIGEHGFPIDRGDRPPVRFMQDVTLDGWDRLPTREKRLIQDAVRDRHWKYEELRAFVYENRAFSMDGVSPSGQSVAAGFAFDRLVSKFTRQMNEEATPIET